jgi:hypothetical protein
VEHYPLTTEDAKAEVSRMLMLDLEKGDLVQDCAADILLGRRLVILTFDGYYYGHRLGVWIKLKPVNPVVFDFNVTLAEFARTHEADAVGINMPLYSFVKDYEKLRFHTRLITLRRNENRGRKAAPSGFTAG